MKAEGLRFAVIGDPIAHSRSPEIYAPMFESAGIDADFLRLRITPAELASIRCIVEKERLSGFAVTMPHKLAVIPFLDALTASAERSGSVNIVSVERGKKLRLIGHNTDGEGFIASLVEAGVSVNSKRVLFLGKGGAARGAAASVIAHGGEAEFITRTHSRSGAEPIEAAITRAQQQGVLSRADILVNATPLGMSGGKKFSDLSFIENLKGDCAVFDMVYRPNGGATELVARAKASARTAIGGERMLLHQAALAFFIWSGRKYVIQA